MFLTMLALLVACHEDPAVACGGDSDFAGPDDPAWILDFNGDLPALALDISGPNLEVLRAEADGGGAWVCGALEVEGYGTLANVGIQLKGKVGSSFQPVDNKPYLQIDLGRYVDGQTLSGLGSVRLYNQWQDTGQVQRYLGYKLWRDASYPAPRASFATLSLNGRDLGLYGVSESVDAQFVADRRDFFPPDGGSIFEGEYGADITTDHAPLVTTPAVDLLELEVGDSDRVDLEALAAAVAEGRDLFGDPATAALDRDRFARFWALEMLVGAQEGYTYVSNNFYVREEAVADGTRFTLLPWGFDMVLYHALPFDLPPSGDLAALGLSTPDGRARLATALACEAHRVDWAGLEAEMDAVIAVIEPVYLAQFGADATFTPPIHAVEVEQRHDAIRYYLQHRQAEALAWAAEQGVELDEAALADCFTW